MPMGPTIATVWFRITLALEVALLRRGFVVKILMSWLETIVLAALSLLLAAVITASIALVLDGVF